MLSFLACDLLAYDEIIEGQVESFGITEFLKQSKKYISENFDDLDLQDIFNSSLQGKVKFSGTIGKFANIMRGRAKGNVIFTDSYISCDCYT